MAGGCVYCARMPDWERRQWNASGQPCCEDRNGAGTPIGGLFSGLFQKTQDGLAKKYGDLREVDEMAYYYRDVGGTRIFGQGNPPPGSTVYTPNQIPGGTSTTPMMGTAPSTRSNLGQTEAQIGSIGCGLLPPGPARDICLGVIGILRPGEQSGGGNGSLAPQERTQTGPCPDGSILIGDRCVVPGDLFPGGDPGIVPAGQQAVEGSFGLPAVTPTMEQRVRRKCPTGMVLAIDNLCYPKGIGGISTPRGRFRKWKRTPKPPVTRAQARALQQIDSIRDSVKDLARKADLAVTSKAAAARKAERAKHR